jgi:hypothetical protein
MEMDVFREVSNSRKRGIHIVRQQKQRWPKAALMADGGANLSTVKVFGNRYRDLRNRNRDAALSFWLNAKWYCNIRYWKQVAAASGIYSTTFVLWTYLAR